MEKESDSDSNASRGVRKVCFADEKNEELSPSPLRLLPRRSTSPKGKGKQKRKGKSFPRYRPPQNKEGGKGGNGQAWWQKRKLKGMGSQKGKL